MSPCRVESRKGCRAAERADCWPRLGCPTSPGPWGCSCSVLLRAPWLRVGFGQRGALARDWGGQKRKTGAGGRRLGGLCPAPRLPTPHPRSSCILASFRLCAAIVSHGSGSLGAPVAGCPPSLLPGHRSPSGCSPCQVWATDSPPLFALLTSPILWQPVSSLKYCHLNPIPLPTRTVAHKPSHREPTHPPRHGPGAGGFVSVASPTDGFSMEIR